MLHLYYNSWDYWDLRQKVTFDGVRKTVTVNPAEPLLNIRNDVYSAWVDWFVLEDNLRFASAIRVSGYDPIPGGFTGATFFMTNGWKLIIELTDVKVDGVLYSDDYDTAFFTPTGKAVYPALVSSVVNSTTTTQNVVTGDISTVPTPAAVASQVRTELAVELAKMDKPISSRSTPADIFAAL